MDHSAVTSPPSGITTDPFQIVPPQEFRPAPPRPTLDPRHRTRDRATLRIARWSATHPWRSVSAWILLVVFGALLAAGVPVLLGLSAVAAASGLSALVSQLVPSTGSTSAMILLMGMAVGVDYSLFYVKRYREERARNQEHLDAVQIAAETSGHSVQVSGLAVIISMASLFIVGDVTFASLGAGSILVVAIAVLGSLTVLPALLAGLGRAMDRPRVPLVWRLAASTRAPRLWPALLRPALNHPGRTLVASVLLLLFIAAPALGMTLRDPDDASLPRSVAEVSTLDRMTEAFPDDRSSYDVVVTAPAEGADAVERRLREFGTQLGTEPC